MKILYFLISLTVLQSNSLLLNSQDLQFYREDILFSIDETRVITDAEYYFCHVGDKDIRMSLLYPFPKNTMDLIDSLVVENLKTNAAVPYREARSGIFFEIYVKAYGQAAYRVYFRQKLNDGHFTYILNSTHTWGKALEIANYELRLPLPLNLDSLSYLPDTSFIQNDIKHYKWNKTDFMPEKNFEVFFH